MSTATMRRGRAADLDLSPDPVPNRYLKGADWADPRYTGLRERFNGLYGVEMAGEPHPFGSTRPETIVTHWSREWEYPWTVLNGRFEAGMRVADLGCGGSPLLILLVRKLGCVGVGIDLNLTSATGKNNLRGFARPAAELYPEIEWRLRSMDDTGLDDASMDRVACVSVLEHVGERVAASTFREMARVLKPGGLALLTTDVGGDHRTLTIDFRRLLELAAEAGLELEGRSDWTPAPDRPGTYDVVGFVLRKG